MHTKRGFTLIELTVILGIVALLAAITLASYTKGLVASRDAKRKIDVKGYTSALQQYRISNGNDFIRLNSVSCAANSMSASNVNCTGLGGASYGRMNYINNPGSVYTPTSIAAMLKKLGLISTVAFDPSSKSDPTIDNQPDYVLVRCDAQGIQIPSSSPVISALSSDDTFAVWANLEQAGATSLTEIENTTHFCGGSSAKASSTAFIFGYPLGSTVFPAPTSIAAKIEQTGGYYAIGNGRPKLAPIQVANSSTPPPVTPVATLTASPSTIRPGDDVTFSAGLTSSDNSPVTYDFYCLKTDPLPASSNGQSSTYTGCGSRYVNNELRDIPAIAKLVVHQGPITSTAVECTITIRSGNQMIIFGGMP